MAFLLPLRKRVDTTQRSHAFLGFPLAVIKKFSEDRAGKLAALIAYYGFFALFPLMLVFVTILGMVLHGHPTLQLHILRSALAQFPIIGDQIRENVHSLTGGGLALSVGIAGALWAGLGGIKAVQNALDTVWGVPRERQPHFAQALKRGVVMLAVLGTFTIVGTGLAGISGASGTPFALKAAGFAASMIVDVVVFLLAFKILTVEDVSWRDVLPGAVIAGIGWSLLQLVGSYYVAHQLKNASQTYGFFGVVIGLLSWLYLGAQLMLIAAEVNVVRARSLWPRSILAPGAIPIDRRTLAQNAKVEERSPTEAAEANIGGPR